MDIVESQCCLNEEFAGSTLIKSTLSVEEVEKVSILSILKQYADFSFIIFLDVVVESNDVWMVNLLVEVDFTFDVDHIVPRYCSQVNLT